MTRVCRQVAVVFEVAPETDEYDREWALVDVNIPRARGRDAEEYCWIPESIKDIILCEGLPDALWGDERDVPFDVLAGGKFVALGTIEVGWSGYPGEEEYDEAFVVDSYRKI